MKAFTAIVEDGAVKFPAGAHVRDGTRVFVAVLGKRSPESEMPPYPPDLEAEDVEFARACRGRLAKQLDDEDA